MSRTSACTLYLCLPLTVVGQSRSSPGDVLFHPLTVLNGTVTDSTGAAISNASIELMSAESKPPAKAITDAVGHYRLFVSAAGIYRETINASGFRAVVIEDLKLLAGAETFRDVVLQVGPARDSVIVNGAPQIAGGQVAIEGRVGIFGEVPAMSTPFRFLDRNS